MIELAWLIPIVPAIAIPIIFFFTRKFELLSALVALAGIMGAFILSLGVAWDVWTQGVTMALPREYGVQWLLVEKMKIEAGILVDPMTAVMLLVVTSVALLVEIYSIGYMHGEPGFSSFFGYLSLFASSMLGLVVANNYFEIFFFWELVGLGSYLLIGFYYHKNSAAEANKKAFITNRVGDFGFLLGFLMLFLAFGTFNFGELAHAIEGYNNVAFLTLAGVLILVGPMAKSAQFPLHVWLPDAMEGPTPVSALIHAATMVAAGVYLIARGYVLFASSEQTALIIAYLGGFSSIFAASIGLVQRDIKRILAFSTMSQLGYMVMALGVGSLTAGMFHLTTHAFFKALLFLGAGSVIHSVGTQDIFEMGAVAKKMKITTTTFIIGALALSGVFPLAGFWSKDEILLATYENGFTGLYIIGSIVAFMTAFYMFRLIFVAFFGEKRSDYHGHESPLTMTIPLIILSVFAIFTGFIGAPFVEHGFSYWVYFEEAHHAEPNLTIMISSTILALAGIFLAWLIYLKGVVSPEALAERFRSIHTLLYNKFYIDDFYQWFFDKVVMNIAEAFNWNDRHIVDAIFDGLGDLTRGAGERMRFIHSGQLQNYALVIFGAAVLFLLWMAMPVLGGI